ncbi:hypothetical protein KI809_18585 [Geobacter pelophilus]|uniref:MFS transporter n=1 Tax=Geoanaerobacter pelophilus TaxID=60036 RepID=A0AAW4LB50_9BACT|nr:hypothetical protein [Geoanaerobacter pelophilus]MBT0666323.1 hypothetical protein [Geoanaerobacter pelophilus]
MSDNIILENSNKTKPILWVTLLAWLAIVLFLGVNETLAREPGTPPIPLLIAVVAPILVYLTAYWSVARFRELVLSSDLQFAAGIQTWRFGGLAFIALYVYGVLPGLFAWPAGLGDMAIGITAVWVIRALRDRPDFVKSKAYRTWNLLGILDLVTAVSLGALSAYLGIGTSETISTFPMVRLPLVLIPAFLVPLFIMMHLTSLIQSRKLAATGKSCAWVGQRILCGMKETTTHA